MKNKDIVFRDSISLKGPASGPTRRHRNLDRYRELEDFPSDKIPGLYERLSLAPGLIEHRCNYDVRGGFLQRLKEGTWTGHILNTSSSN
jgi:cyanophycin synthetase